MTSWLSRNINRGAAIATVPLVALSLAQSSTAAAGDAEPTPGSAGIGDRLFSTLGNGGYDVQSYDLKFVHPAKDPAQPVTGSVTITARATQALSRFNLDFGGDAAGTAAVDGRAASMTVRGEELEVTPRRAIAKGATFVVTVKGFTATPVRPAPDPDGDDRNQGGFGYTDDGTFLNGEPDKIHDLFPGSDHPADKASYRFAVDVPQGWTAATSGVPVGRPTTSKGRTLWRYAQREPMAMYAMQYAAGSYQVVDRGTVDGVRVRDVVPRRLARELEPQLATVTDQLDWMRDQVGAYPFPRYGSLVVEDDLRFALETQTLSLYSTYFFDEETPAYDRYPIMLHELSHQWFGDDVSPKTWSDLWLSEGHATFYQQSFSAERGYLQELGWTDLEAYWRAVYELSDQIRAASGPVARPDSSAQDVLFGLNTYYGGALALYALQQEIGEQRFEQLERQWVARGSGESKTTDDYIALASTVAGRDLEPFLEAWLYSTRTPAMPGHPDWKVEPVPAAAEVAGGGESDRGMTKRQAQDLAAQLPVLAHHPH
jgi:aminopeptidase N